MINPSLDDLAILVEIAQKAGNRVMTYYNSKKNIKYKNDNSPVTDADIASHNFINDALHARYPEIPILSEESLDKIFLDEDSLFWCVDPLDGTKEFIKKNDEFTINIALIFKKTPIIGVIDVPAKKISYGAFRNGGAYKKNLNCSFIPIKVKKQKKDNLVFAVSRSHLDSKTKCLVKSLNGKSIMAGSALKLAYVAEGIVDIYPRFSPSMIWDIAAGHIIVEEAGGKVKTISGNTLSYDVKKPVNQAFFAMNQEISYP